jgi:predicted nucleic acid-binding protein
VTSRGLLDTSVFIANETGRPLDVGRLPDQVAISVVTLAELNAGVLAAKDVETRALRLATVEALADIELLPVDAATAMMWARMRVQLAESGRRVNVNAMWIAATAATRGLPVVTQDSDFDPLAGIAGLRVVKV